MLVNFALELLGTKVSSNKVNTDGYDCTNLISSDITQRRKGFLAEHFIKPSVDITFTFPCNINIYCILLNPFVGRQQSSFLEIYSATKPWPKSHTGNMKRLTGLLENGPHSSQTQSLEENLSIYHPLCKTNVPIQTRACFYNRRFPSYISRSHENLLSSVDSSASYEIRSARANLLTSCSHLMIRIARTQNGSTPAISNIEIWGSVSSQVNKEVHSIINNKFETYNESRLHQNDFFMEHANTVPTSSNLGIKETSDSEKLNLHFNLNCDDTEIPEEFLDSLTCEIMAIPMLLPSGKNIDKLTLDRYFDSEASYGRLPRDPFTGVEFHGISKPLPNMPLKARIDHFLLENKNKPSLASLPRTVVSGNERINSQSRKRKLADSNAPQISSIVHNNNSNSKTSNLCSNSNFLEQNKSDYSLSSNASFHSSPNSSLASTSTSKFRTNEDHSRSQRSIKETPVKSADHESSLKDSLNHALFAVLDSSSKTSSSEMTDPMQISYSDTFSIPKHNVLCSKCDKTLSDELVSYMTPCFHFLCRPCLLSQNATQSKITCHTCDAVCLKSQVVRTHSRINNV